MTTAVWLLFLAPIGIASGGGHGSSAATLSMSRGLLGTEEGRAFFGWLETPADFFGSESIGGGFADSFVVIPGVKSNGRYDGIVPSHTTKLPFGSVSYAFLFPGCVLRVSTHPGMSIIGKPSCNVTGGSTGIL